MTTATYVVCEDSRYKCYGCHKEGTLFPEYSIEFFGKHLIEVSNASIRFNSFDADMDDPLFYRALVIAKEMADALSSLECLEYPDFFLYPEHYGTTMLDIATAARAQKFFVLSDEVKDKLIEVDKVFAPPQIKSHQRTKREGFVYILKSETGHYKIGKTTNPDNRIKTFSVKLPFRVEYELLIPSEDHNALEIELHTRFAYCRLDGEWFALTDGDVNDLRREFIS